MKRIQLFGRLLFIASMILFSLVPFFNRYAWTETALDRFELRVSEDQQAILMPILRERASDDLFGKFELFAALDEALETANPILIQSGGYAISKGSYWHKEYRFWAAKYTSASWPSVYKDQLSLLFLALLVIGALMHIIPMFWDGPAGIKNNGVFHDAATSKGWIGILAGIYFIGFYIVIYFFPYLFSESVALADPIAGIFGTADASYWFLYGLLYTIAVVIMGIRMFAKYRHNNYHLVRTSSVIFFQLGFAFLLPEILRSLHLPAYDLKNIWPLDYSLFFDWRLNDHLSSSLGIVFLIFSIANIFITVPLMTFLFGKRWYCSWVCGCGGLAETLGDPYRQLSDKSLNAWKIERYLIHAVLVFALLMTAFVLYHFFTGTDRLLGISAYTIRDIYGLLISSIFAGVVGTGFYPLMGNRVWCRFGCPLSAIFGIIQRFRSRFRITTNGGQCISCGNCSTYCEQGIDVRWYAQRGQNIVRASCVGCGVCSSVCPRGVLRLENGSQEGRINDLPVLIGRDGVNLQP